MTHDVKASYARVVNEYVRRIYGELDHKPFDRKMLDWLIEKMPEGSLMCDMGCGPGQVAQYLHSHGAAACGIDLSPDMIWAARKLNPDLDFSEGDMLALTDIADGTYGAIAAFYSLIHIPRDQVETALREFYRVLTPGGVVLLAFHIGREMRHLDEWWGQTVALDFLFFEGDEMKGFLQAAGFEIEEAIERDPYGPEIESQTRRAYLFARRPI